MRNNIEAVATCRISRFIAPISEGRSAETWKVSIQGTPRPGYLKLCSAKELVAELVAAKCGRAAELPIPEPLLTEIHQSRLPMESAFRGNDVIVGFVSMSAGETAKSFEQFLQRNEYGGLANWNQLLETIAFDEWIANEDRNPTNLLYCPDTKTYWLIDHGNALFGPSRDLWPLVADRKSNNVLLNKWTDRGVESHQRNLIEKTRILMAKCALQNLDMIDGDGHISRLESPEKAAEISLFLAQRIFRTGPLLCHKIGSPQLPM